MIFEREQRKVINSFPLLIHMGTHRKYVSKD